MMGITDIIFIVIYVMFMYLVGAYFREAQDKKLEDRLNVKIEKCMQITRESEDRYNKIVIDLMGEDE